jgi:hypothetical protein
MNEPNSRKSMHELIKRIVRYVCVWYGSVITRLGIAKHGHCITRFWQAVIQSELQEVFNAGS